MQGVYDQAGILTCANNQQTFEDVLAGNKLSGQNNHHKHTWIRGSKFTTCQDIYFSRVNTTQKKSLGDHKTIGNEHIQL